MLLQITQISPSLLLTSAICKQTINFFLHKCFLEFSFFRNHASMLGVRLIHKCGLYTSLYGINLPIRGDFVLFTPWMSGMSKSHNLEALNYWMYVPLMALWFSFFVFAASFLWSHYVEKLQEFETEHLGQVVQGLIKLTQGWREFWFRVL